MIQLNLRLRITAAIAFVCLAIVTILGVTLYIASEDMEYALVEQLVSEELDFLIERHSANPEHMPTPGPNIQYYVVGSPDESTRLPAYLHDLAPGHYDMDIGGDQGERHVVIRQIDNTRYIVVYNIGAYEDREYAFKRLTSLSLLVIAILALITGYFLAGYLTRQLSLLAQHVAVLDPNQPNPLLLNDKQDVEVAMVAKALDQYQVRILEMIKREQEFTSNVSHELRTPLTVMHTSCELLAKDPNLNEKARQRVSYIRNAVDKMAQHTNALLFLAREQTLAAKEMVALLECVNDVMSLMNDNLQLKKLSFETDIAADTFIETNRQALQIVLANLFKNAINYTEHGFIRVSYNSNELTIADSGAGIAADKLSHIFDRNYRGDTNMAGYGIGLDIVKRICNQVGWTIRVESTPGVGSRFILKLA